MQSYLTPISNGSLSASREGLPIMKRQRSARRQNSLKGSLTAQATSNTDDDGVGKEAPRPASGNRQHSIQKMKTDFLDKRVQDGIR